MFKDRAFEQLGVMCDQRSGNDERCRDLKEARGCSARYTVVLLPESSVVAEADDDVVCQALLVHRRPYSLVKPQEDRLYGQVTCSEHRSPDMAISHSLLALQIIEESLPFWTGEPDAVD